MTLDEYLDYTINEGFTVDEAIEKASKIKFFKLLYSKERYESIIKARQKPLLDWMEDRTDELL